MTEAGTEAGTEAETQAEIEAEAVDFDAVLDRYLAEVLRTGEGDDARPVQPKSEDAPSPYDLRRVLADPRVLFGPDRTAARSRLGALIAFAWRAAHWPRDQVPGELVSRVARFRFLVWSFPARFGMRSAHRLYAGIPSPEDPERLVDADFILSEARAARQDWKGYLDTSEDDPWLAQRQAVAPEALEHDFRWLAIAWPATQPPPEQTEKWPGAPAPLDLGSAADQQRVADDTGERLLERGSVAGAAEALAPGRWWRWPLLAWFPTAAAVVIALALSGQGSARWVAVGVLTAGLVSAVVAPTRVTPLGLLRIPAAAAVGLAVLVSLTSRWWIAPDGWMVGVALIGAGVGYLMIEARQYGAPRWAAVRRGLLVAAIGVLHAAVLSVAALGFVVPAMGENGECVAGWWQHDPWRPLPVGTSDAGLPPGADSCAVALRTDHAAAPGGVLVLMTGWSLSFGLAAQILWEDRPVTAPLARLRRVRGGK